MARRKGMGNLQHEKNGTWTIRIGYCGRRYSRATGTSDLSVAEKTLQRMLCPLGLGDKRLPLADVWSAYLCSPNRRDLAQATLDSKRMIWMAFARWMEARHFEVSSLAEVTSEAIAEYLMEMKLGHCATTYNNNVCTLREIFHVLSEKAGLLNDPWHGVRLRADDSHSRRELTIIELNRLLSSANAETSERPDAPHANEWHLLFVIGLYTGLRLGDCCRLAWSAISLERGIIQVVPRKTRRHLHGKPVTIPIHPTLAHELQSIKPSNSPFVLPTIAELYLTAKWRVSSGIERIFTRAGITMSVQIDGRRRKTPEATFHSLRHTFVSLSANAGIPIAVVQSIVGHCSTAMTRHYYHENETALRAAISALPSL